MKRIRRLVWSDREKTTFDTVRHRTISRARSRTSAAMPRTGAVPQVLREQVWDRA